MYASEKKLDIGQVRLTELPENATILRLITESDLSADQKDKLLSAVRSLHHWRQYVAPRVADEITVVKAVDALMDRALLGKGFFETAALVE